MSAGRQHSRAAPDDLYRFRLIDRMATPGCSFRTGNLVADADKSETSVGTHLAGCI
jgi:hypothetical protein